MDSFSPQVVLTRDGSHSLYAPQFDQHYHSLQGSIQESRHIYIELGLRPFLLEPSAEPVRVFEMGLGTGLNALLTWQLADLTPRPVFYEAVEAHPVSTDQWEQLNYDELTGHGGLGQLHQAAWGRPIALSPHFTFTKHPSTLQAYLPPSEPFDLIYYDAFAPSVQPELWTEEIFHKIASFTRRGGRLVTYCTKGDVKRALRNAGFRVKRYPGPWGKREVLRAEKV